MGASNLNPLQHNKCRAAPLAHLRITQQLHIQLFRWMGGRVGGWADRKVGGWGGGRVGGWEDGSKVGKLMPCACDASMRRTWSSRMPASAPGCWRVVGRLGQCAGKGPHRSKISCGYFWEDLVTQLDAACAASLANLEDLVT